MRDDFRLPLDVLRLGVEQLVRNAVFVKKLCNLLRTFDRSGTDEHGPSLLVHARDFLAHGVPLAGFRAEDDVGGILARDRSVCRHDSDFELVNVTELGDLRFGGTSHTAELGVGLEESLVRHRGDGDGFVLNRHAFLGFDGLV